VGEAEGVLDVCHVRLAEVAEAQHDEAGAQSWMRPCVGTQHLERDARQRSPGHQVGQLRVLGRNAGKRIAQHGLIEDRYQSERVVLGVQALLVASGTTQVGFPPR
jgi:hypothetical protein